MASVHTYPCSHFFSVEVFPVQFDAHCIFLHFYGSRLELTKIIHQVILADMLYLSAMETTSTTWTSCDQFVHQFAGRFVPPVDVTHDDGDRKSHMSDIPLQLPASASVASNNYALVTFSQAEDDFMRNVPGLYPILSQTGGNPWHSQYHSAHGQGSQQFLDLKKLFNWWHNEHVKL